MAYAGGSAERTVFECLGILHERGYELLRLSSGHSPSGMSLRYEIAPATYFRPDGMRLKSERYGTALMTSSSGKLPPFGWPDAVDLDPQKLADLFLERCPQLAEAGLGHDRAYAAWYWEMLAATRPNGFVASTSMPLETALRFSCLNTRW